MCCVAGAPGGTDFRHAAGLLLVRFNKRDKEWLGWLFILGSMGIASHAECV